MMFRCFDEFVFCFFQLLLRESLLSVVDACCCYFTSSGLIDSQVMMFCLCGG